MDSPSPRSTSKSPDSTGPPDEEEADIAVADVARTPGCRGLLPLGRQKGAAVQVEAAVKEGKVGGRRRFRCTPAPVEEEEDEEEEAKNTRVNNVAGVRTVGVAARRGARIECEEQI